MVKSAARVFELLELFDAERRPLRVTEIVQRLDLPQSSVSMLLRTLVARGYMEFDATDRSYCPSVRISFLNEWAMRGPSQRHDLQEAMRRLADATGESVLLGRQSGLLLQYVSIIESHRALRFSPTPGTLRPMHRTAIGIMLLSRQDDAQIGLLLRRYNAEKRGPTARIQETFRAIAVAREQGWYASSGLATPGAGVIATLMPTPIRRQRLAIGVGVPLDRLHSHRKQLLEAVLAAAQATAGATLR